MRSEASSFAGTNGVGFGALSRISRWSARSSDVRSGGASRLEKPSSKSASMRNFASGRAAFPHAVSSSFPASSSSVPASTRAAFLPGRARSRSRAFSSRVSVHKSPERLWQKRKTSAFSASFIRTSACRRGSADGANAKRRAGTPGIGPVRSSRFSHAAAGGSAPPKSRRRQRFFCRRNSRRKSGAAVFGGGSSRIHPRIISGRKVW